VENEISDYPQILLRREGWILEDPTLVRLSNRLMEQGTPLGEFVKGRMYWGIKAGLNEAFVIDQAKRDELIAEDPCSAELIKPWLRGQDIKRWRAEWAELYIIAVQCSGDSDANYPWKDARTEKEARDIFRQTYPAIHDHLSWWEQKLRRRADQGRFWWELRACAYYNEFEQVKITWGNLAITSKFALERNRAVVSAPANILANPPEWLLAIMNSSLLNFIYPKLTVSRGGGFQEFKIGYISPAPIVTPPTQIQSKLNQLQDKLTSNILLESEEKQRLESEIDELVFDIYKVGVEERALLREWRQLRYPTQGNTSESENEQDREANDE